MAREEGIQVSKGSRVVNGGGEEGKMVFLKGTAPAVRSNPQPKPQP